MTLSALESNIVNFAGTAHLSCDPSTFVDVLEARADAHPNRVAYTFLADGDTREQNVTYAQLSERSKAIAAMLQSRARPGDRVLLLYPPSVEYIAAFFGCLNAGMIAVPAYPPRPNQGLQRIETIVSDSQMEIALTTLPILKRAETCFTQVPGLAGMQWVATDTLPVQLADEWQRPLISGDTIAFLQYTSGSTAAPKGVMVSHLNLLHNEDLIQRACGHTRESTFVAWLPLYHDMGLIGNVLQPLYIGARSVLMSPVAFLQRPFVWLEAISKYRAHTSGGPNFAYDLCVRKTTPEQRSSLDLSCWKIAFNGSEPIRFETLERFANAFGPCGFDRRAFYPCYGLAEATLFVSGGGGRSTPLFKEIEPHALAVNRVAPCSGNNGGSYPVVASGRTWPDQRVAIVDPDTLRACAPDQIGEIWLCGPSVAAGYWGQPDETERTFHAYLSDSGDGPFFRTGDLGFICDDQLFVTGRLKDLIIIGGRNHYPHDIELTVEKHCPVTRPGCIAAFPVDVDGEERLVIAAEVDPRYRIVRDADTFQKASHSKRRPLVDPDSIVAAIRQAVAEEHEARVYSIVLLEAGTIPKTSSGKLQRRACRSRFLSNSLVTV